MPISTRFLPLSAAVAACAALCALGTTSAAAAPASDAQGFVDSTARCAAPSTAVAFGATASSRIAICKSANGKYEYRGVRVRDGAKLILAATSTGEGVYTAANQNITYTVSSQDLTVSTGGTVIREEPMVQFHGPSAPASSAPGNPGYIAPDTPTPTTPLPPPLPAEVGGAGS
jgi:hypothetical protein